MRKILTAALAALTLGGAIAATATPAAARPHGYGPYGYGGYGGYRYYGGHHHHNDVAGPAIAAGVAGLALGAALASSSRPAYGYYNNGYYNYPRANYGYAPGYAPGYYGGGYCESSRWVYDPYIGRRVLVRSSYAC